MDDVVWESLCEQLWRGSLLAKDVKVEGCSSNPLFGPWSQCKASQTSIERHVTMLDVALPSAFCRLAQPGELLFASQSHPTFLNIMRISGLVCCDEVRRLSYRESYQASLRDRLRTHPVDIEFIQATCLE